MAAQLHYPSVPTAAASHRHVTSFRRPLAGNLRLLPSPPAISSARPLHVTFSSNPNLTSPNPTLGSSNPNLAAVTGSSNLYPNLAVDLGSGSGVVPPGGFGSGGGGGGGDDRPEKPDSDPDSDPAGFLDFLLRGWRSRVAADPQFPFKVLMEEIVGVTSCVLGDMASRPNFGLNELDFVFSTLVVGSIVNFVLMYLLAPTAAASLTSPSTFPSYMFESGKYSLSARLGTFAYKGFMFAAVGFAAGLAGTAISNGLIALRKKMDPEFETPNAPPSTVLNATTWAIHMGLNSNFRYQALNGVEYAMERALPAAGFKATVVVLRCLNNVIGGMSFVVLARMMGSQKSGDEGELKERLIEAVAAGEGVEELKGINANESK